MSAIEPSAPPDYFTQNSKMHDGHETMATIYKKSEMESNSDTQSPRKQEVAAIAVDVIPFYKRSKDMYGIGFKKKRTPTEIVKTNCTKWNLLLRFRHTKIWLSCRSSSVKSHQSLSTIYILIVQKVKVWTHRVIAATNTTEMMLIMS